MPLLNDFLLGADPEFIIINNGHMQAYINPVERYAPWGIDHSGWVIEPHPKPELSVRALISNLHVSLNDFATVAPAGKWRAGAYFHCPERNITMGGHVHIDKPAASQDQVLAMDKFTEHMEALDLLPSEECATRRGSGHYGRMGDIRTERGRWEYRTFASWLFSQRITKLCLTGAKLCVVDPAAAGEVLGARTTASVAKLKAYFERFRHKDEDVDWLLSGKIFDKALKIKPDRDLREVWKVKPEKEVKHWKAAAAPAETVPHSDFFRYAFRVGEHIVSTNLMDTFRLRAGEADQLLNRITETRPGLLAPITLNGRLFTYIGLRGDEWPIGVPVTSIRFEHDRIRYTWRVWTNQYSARSGVILRAAVRNGQFDNIPDRVQLIGGVMCALAGVTPVLRRELDNNF